MEQWLLFYVILPNLVSSAANYVKLVEVKRILSAIKCSLECSLWQYMIWPYSKALPIISPEN